MTPYQAQSLKSLMHTEPVKLMDTQDNEIWQTDMAIENVLVFYFPRHKFSEIPGSTSLQVGKN